MAITREDIQKEEGLAALLFEEDIRELEKYLKNAHRRLRTLWNKLKDIVREEGVDESNYKEHLEKNPQLTKLLKSLLIQDKKKYVVNLIYKTVFGIENIPKAINKILLHVRRAKILEYVKKKRAPDKGKEALPPEFYQFLPDTITFDFDAAGNVKDFVDHFENKVDNLRVKAKRMASVLENWSQIIKTVKKDIASGSDKEKLLGLMVAVIIETGMRPSRPGSSVMKRMPDGKVVELETLGITKIRREHLDIIRGNFARLSFIGKKGITNVADIEDSQLIKELNDLVKKRKAKDMIFVTKKGKTLTYNHLSRYFNDKFGQFGIQVSDFRKLKSTVTVFKNVKDGLKELYDMINVLVEKRKRGIKQAITKLVLDFLQKAFEQAQAKLSHVELRNTINYYVNPKIVLQFLQDPELDETIEDALLKGKAIRIGFDPEVFIKRAAIHKGAAGIFTLKLVPSETTGLEEIKEQIKEEYDSIIA